MLEKLLKGESIRCPMDEQKVISREKEEEVPWGRRPEYELAFTNCEVRRMFESMVLGWVDEPDGGYNDFVEALLRGDRKARNVYMNEVARNTFSYFDTGKRPSREEPERFYVVTSNKESGFGRYDVTVEPKDREKGTAFLLEFKVHDLDEEKTLEDTVRAAHAQIEGKKVLIG